MVGMGQKADTWDTYIVRPACKSNAHTPFQKSEALAFVFLNALSVERFAVLLPALEVAM